MPNPGRERKSQQSKPGRDKSAPHGAFSAAAIRETIESLAVALVIAMLLRAFLMEAFVIPTGSMAPTLMGRHKELQCPQCGYWYPVGASIELTEDGSPTGVRVIAGTCPMCRHTLDVGPRNTLGRSDPSYSGDRILVSKVAYQTADPQRWDVAVFHYPLHAATNYVKRVAGLAGETLRIQYGDVWTRAPGAADFTIARKPPLQVLATLQPVFDIDYVIPALVRKGWPRRWEPVEPRAAGAWRASEDLKSFRTDGAAEEAWLAYQHCVPGYEDWAELAGLLAVKPSPPGPQLISDFTSYDTEVAWPFGFPGAPAQQRPPEALPGGLGVAPNPASLGLNWVGDLAVEFELASEGPGGEIHVELVKGGRRFLCRFDLARGDTVLTIPAAAARRSGQGVRGPGRHTVRFANVDQQLLAWVDERPLAFDQPTTYELAQVDTRVPDQADLVPVRIGSRRAAATVSRLKISRDIYYIAQQPQGHGFFPGPPTDLDPRRSDYPYENLTREAVRRFFSDPDVWSVFGHRLGIEFRLGADQFFMLGDNSAQSKDSRLWDGSQFYVDRNLLIGKALYVYWPHSWDKIPGTPIPFPFFPNFGRMRLVR